MAKQCPRCGADVPVVRMPTSIKQALWGGSTCKGCGAELTRSGKLKTP